jgi:hypothetical protein
MKADGIRGLCCGARDPFLLVAPNSARRGSAARGLDHNVVVLAAWTQSFAPGGEAESPDSIGVPAKRAMSGWAAQSRS